ncbi:membrane protein [Gordoniibacillus kamchatkensis]|uniref:Membrane protein n=1 Tax=Gordoniibacillus kamchatkensis TaxID=1590651 RepID=A0ABR5AGP4_9BACL|nr:permease [Paenibacillus sp. VKM B-2647]KIL39903.1 membrane protein [Paenibacillus sp. VKM B-2647]
MNNAAINGRKSGNAKTVISVLVFVLIAAAGLTYVKWYPYYLKALQAAAKHSIGGSIVTGAKPAAPDPSWSAAWDYAKAYYNSVWKAAVLGIVLGSLVQVLIPSAWLSRTLGRTNFGSTLFGGLFSLPGMMCTCCAAPLAVGLRKKQVSPGAALAFWLGNPTLNPATILFMVFVLPWPFAVLRVLLGILLVFGVSYAANRLSGPTVLPEAIQKQQEERLQASEGPLLMRWLKTLWSLTLHIVPAYVIAVLVLGAARAWLFPVVGEAWSNSILVIIGFAIAGMLFVIPTAAEIPIVQTLMAFGLGAGPAAALSITLPAVSLPSLLMVRKAFPPRVLAFVAASVVVLGVFSGIVAAVWL